MARRRPGGSGRAVRVRQQIHEELAELVRAQLKDPHLGMVTITGVELTPDYAYATVYYSVLPDDEATVARTQAGLGRAAGFLRSQLGRQVRIHTTPELRFVRDTTTGDAVAIAQLIDEANRLRADE